MADNTADGVYDDPDNILADTDDTVDPGPEPLPEYEKAQPSQSIFVPEANTTPYDTRGPIEVQSVAEDHGGDTEQIPDDDEDNDETLTEIREGGPYRTGQDIDSDHLSDVEPSDERQGESA